MTWPRRRRCRVITNPPTKVTSLETRLNLYRTVATVREIDRVELDLVRRGLAFFHVAGAGHEATACLARHLTPDDWLHVHYRDKALLLARGLPIEEFFASLLCRAGSHSAGRQMSAHFSTPHLNVRSQTGPVGNHALQAVGVAAARRVGIAHHETTNGEASSVDGSVGNALRGVPSRTDESSIAVALPTDGSVGNALRANPVRHAI